MLAGRHHCVLVHDFDLNEQKIFVELKSSLRPMMINGMIFNTFGSFSISGMLASFLPFSPVYVFG